MKFLQISKAVNGFIVEDDENKTLVFAAPENVCGYVAQRLGIPPSDGPAEVDRDSAPDEPKPAKKKRGRPAKAAKETEAVAKPEPEVLSPETVAADAGDDIDLFAESPAVETAEAKAVEHDKEKEALANVAAQLDKGDTNADLLREVLRIHGRYWKLAVTKAKFQDHGYATVGDVPAEAVPKLCRTFMAELKVA